MSKNVYDIFRDVQEKRSTTYNQRSAALIVEGKMSKQIYHKRNTKYIPAALVYKHEEGPDEVIVYSFIKDQLEKGDYFIYDYVNYLIYEQEKYSDIEVNHKKQKAVECNVSFTFGEETFQGYFRSTVRRYNDEDFEGKQVLVPREKPILILPSNNDLTINSEFLIEGKPWRVIEFDSITNKGIIYYYLERGIIKNTEQITVEESSIQAIGLSRSLIPEVKKLEAIIEHTFETKDGIFSSVPKVNIIKRKSNEVTFSIPYNITEITIYTYYLNNELFEVV